MKRPNVTPVSQDSGSPVKPRRDEKQIHDSAVELEWEEKIGNKLWTNLELGWGIVVSSRGSLMGCLIGNFSTRFPPLEVGVSHPLPVLGHGTHVAPNKAAP